MPINVIALICLIVGIVVLIAFKIFVLQAIDDLEDSVEMIGDILDKQMCLDEHIDKTFEEVYDTQKKIADVVNQHSGVLEIMLNGSEEYEEIEGEEEC